MRRSLLLALAVAAALSTPVAGQVPGSGFGHSPEPGAVSRFSADVSVTLLRITPDGGPAAPIQGRQFHVLQIYESGRWRTEVSFRPGVVTVTGLRGPREIPSGPSGFTIVDDGLGNGLTFVRDDGTPIAELPDALTSIMGILARSADPDDPLLKTEVSEPPVRHTSRGPSVFSSAGASHRRAILERTFGPAHGTVRGLDRYLRSSQSTTTEVLADRALGVPVEVNIAENGRLIRQVRYTYGFFPGAGWIRTGVRAEHASNDDEGRMVVESILSNVSLGSEGIHGTR